MIDEDKLGVLIADVSDKGIPAAIYMAVSHTIMRATGLRGLSPAECMRYTNNLLSKDNVESMFVTAFYAILDLKTGHLNYCNAGHNPPYVIDNSGEVTVTKGTGDMVVGVMEGLDYHEAEVQLQSGNTFFLFTDGVTEAYNKNQDLFTEERLEEALVNTNNLSVNELVEKVGVAVSDFASGAVQSDDITMMAISYKG
jgi:sigma-B regulation protein RsbU (phosphoserine phosphatase)